ncbi:MAG: hypothetical protein FJX62_22215 [Alphaproteobacteria bacterium]|nr:hypothetical protein [Alphaproteobacteria bacterium]
MSPLSQVSPSGRIGRGPFAISIALVYLLGFGSQALLSPPVTSRAGVWAFVAAQAALTWLWYTLHVRRLHDAGRPAGTAAGVALVYALEIALLVIVVWLIITSGFEQGSAREDAGILKLFVFLYLIALLTGDPSLGGLGYWLLGFVALLLLPVVIAVCFTLWTATRPSVPAAP